MILPPNVTGAIVLQGINDRDTGSLLGSGALGTSERAGAAGSIFLNANELRIADGGFITSTTAGSGQGGDITINLIGNLTLTGSVIASEARGDTEKAGAGGTINLTAANVSIADGGLISTTTFGPAEGGDVVITATESIHLADTQGNQRNNAIFSEALGSPQNAGDSGTITLTAPRITLLENAAIRTTALNAGGGNITLELPDDRSSMLHLVDSAITSSVRRGLGAGGNIDITSPRFVALNDGRITARADAGSGGNITITAEHLFSTPASVIDASSRRSIDGNISISSPETDITSEINALQTRFDDAAKLLRREVRESQR